MEADEDELVAPGYAFERYTLRFDSVDEKKVEVQINCLERLSLFDAVGLLEGNDCTGLRVGVLCARNASQFNHLSRFGLVLVVCVDISQLIPISLQERKCLSLAQEQVIEY